MNYMNVKEIAELCEKSEKVVRTWIGKIYPEKMKQGYETKLSIEEVEYLFKNVFGQKITAMLMVSSQPNQNAEVDIPNGRSNIYQTGEVVPQNAEVAETPTDTFEILKMMMKEMEERRNKEIEQDKINRALFTAYKEIKQTQTLQIEAPKIEKTTIKGWVNLHPEQFNRPLENGDYIFLGKQASKLSSVLYEEVGNIPDEKYGSVKTYTERVLRQLVLK